MSGLASSCLSLIYLEGKHSLRRLQSGCHQPPSAIQLSAALLDRQFILTLNEKFKYSWLLRLGMSDVEKLLIWNSFCTACSVCL